MQKRFFLLVEPICSAIYFGMRMGLHDIQSKDVSSTDILSTVCVENRSGARLSVYGYVG